MNAAQPIKALTLTPGQQKGFDGFCNFLLSKHEHVFVLEGYAGTGKSTLTDTMIEHIPNLEKSVKLVDPSFSGWDLQLTATTNKACEALAALTGRNVKTIHSFLGLRVHKDYKTGESKLVVRDWDAIKTNQLIFIDEASQIDASLLKTIFALTRDCKIVFMGDPAQLTQVRSSGTPVFTSGFPTAKLTEVVRQAKGNPIIDLATAFRNTVKTGEFFSFKPDGVAIQAVSPQEWGDLIKAEFLDPKWHHNQSKVLAWTNKAVIAYNQAIRDFVQGTPDFQVGDYAVVNSYIPAQRKGSYPLKTDELVHITKIGGWREDYGVQGRMIELNEDRQVFLPISLEARKARIKQAKAEGHFGVMMNIDQNWVDLRAAYSCTIAKSQGSTYDTVFIDLNDVKRCNQPNQIARMLYVAVSRAREKVIFGGDLV